MMVSISNIILIFRLSTISLVTAQEPCPKDNPSTTEVTCIQSFWNTTVGLHYPSPASDSTFKTLAKCWCGVYEPYKTLDDAFRCWEKGSNRVANHVWGDKSYPLFKTACETSAYNNVLITQAWDITVTALPDGSFKFMDATSNVTNVGIIEAPFMNSEGKVVSGSDAPLLDPRKVGNPIESGDRGRGLSFVLGGVVVMVGVASFLM